MSDQTAEETGAIPQIRLVPKDAPWKWLSQGLADFRRAPGVGLAIGLAYAAIGALLTWLTWERNVYYLTFPLMGGFLLIGPLAAVGLYETSRRLAKGKPVGLKHALKGFAKNPTQIAFMGVVLLLIYIAWIRVASLIFMGFFGMKAPSIDAWVFFEEMTKWEHWDFYLVGNLAGAVFALGTFALSVISLPYLMDRPQANVISAMVASVAAVRANFWTMMLWGAIVVALASLGIALGFVGLAVTLPIIGHATWAAYRDLVGWGA